MSKLIVVVGGQWGSEAKGHVAGWLAARERKPIVVRTGGPNAGHTIWRDGMEFKLRQLPTGALTNPHAEVMLAQDTEIDGRVLASELIGIDRHGHAVESRLRVDREATWIEQHHVEQEQELVGRIGSTGKGVGAARAARVMRTALTASVARHWRLADTAELMRKQLADGRTVLLEGSQGYGLGLHAGWYPKCTSRDCRAIDVIAGAGLSVNEARHAEVWVVLRVYPIRVAGDSGGMYNETTWEALGLPAERTTVTNKVRRVGEWDGDLARQAIEANGGATVKVALMMLDHWIPEIRDAEKLDSTQWVKVGVAVQAVERDLGGAKVWLVGTGPRTIVQLRR